MNAGKSPGPDFVVYINWDGFAYQWYKMVNNTYSGTPHVNELLKDGVLCVKAETGVPSITGAMQQCIASGAWPVDTGNFYKYYNLQKNKVIQFARDNRLENIAEAAVRSGVSVASVNAWYFENRGTFEGNVEQPYIQAGLPSNFSKRVDAMIKVINGEPIASGDEVIVFENVPRFLSVYADDIDTVAHNGKVTYEGLLVAETRQQWYDNIAQTIMYMDADLGRFVEALKSKGIYERTAIVLATDHGMVHYGADSKECKGDSFPPEAFTCLPDLAETIALTGQRSAGRRYRVEVLPQGGMSAREETEIVLVPVALQVQVTFRVPLSSGEIAEILSQIREKPYYGAHLEHDELMIRGVSPEYAHLLISARPPYHFRPDATGEVRTVGANHDSLHDGVRHLFTMFSGAGVKKGMTCDETVTIADIAPTIARLLGFEGPRDAVGTALDGVLSDGLRGPALHLSDPNEAENRAVSGGKAVLTGTTDAGALIRINRRDAGTADEQGRFTVESELSTGVNRLVLEAERDGRITRRTIYIKHETAEEDSKGTGVKANIS